MMTLLLLLLLLLTMIPMTQPPSFFLPRPFPQLCPALSMIADGDEHALRMMHAELPASVCCRPFLPTYLP